MKIYFLKNESITRAAEYTINYLLNRSGFFFDWIETPEDIKSQGVLLVYQPKEIQTNYFLPVVSLPKEFNLHELSVNHIKWNIVTFGKVDIPIFINPEKPDLENSNIQVSSFDLFANVYYHLVRLEEINFQHPDDVEKNIEKCILFKYDNFKIPIVDVLCEFFIDVIKKKAEENNLVLLRKSFYPQGENFGIALTHDVDFIRAFHPIKKFLLKLLIRFGLKKNITVKKIDHRDKLTWGFDRLLSCYKENSIKATFFFMAKYLEGWHFRYRIGNSRMKKLMDQLKSDKHEIAFHPSRYAFENPRRYLKEKLKLERVSGSIVSGIRHHYIRCLFPQIWQKASEVNLKYDAGMVYRHHSGFRAGTSSPFSAFDHKNQKQINIIEFPTTFFENTLPNTGNNFEASKNTITQLLETVKERGGIFNVLWHSNNICYPEVYSKLWDFIFNLIKDEDAYTKTLIEHYNWHKLREKIYLQSFLNLEKRFVINITVPVGIDRFSLHIPANYKYKCELPIEFNPIKNLLTIDCTDSNKLISIEALAK